ncbi:hypothetical protein C8J56DRAFT_483380 [Mycena floridula]|nr:hypothetical protein C8J56DRAFT_483380 [Mycena floridula]
MKTNDSQDVEPTTWHSIVKAGLRVKMSALLHVKSTEDSRQCPSCSTVNYHASLGAELICQYCSSTFRVSQGFLEEAGIPHTQISSSPSTDSQARVDDGVNDGTRYIRRFHILLHIEPIRSEDLAFNDPEKPANDKPGEGSESSRSLSPSTTSTNQIIMDFELEWCLLCGRQLDSPGPFCSKQCSEYKPDLSPSTSSTMKRGMKPRFEPKWDQIGKS